MKTVEKKKQDKIGKNKYPRAEKQRAITEISKSINASMTKRYLFDMLFKKQSAER